MKAKKLLNIVLGLSVLGLTTTLTSCGSDALYIAVSPDYAPYEFIDSTKTGQAKYVGSDVQLAKYIGEKLGKEVVIDAMAFDQTLINLQAGKDDLAISGFTYKEDRAANFEMSNSYYDDGEGDQIVIVLKSTYDNGYKTIESLNKKEIVVGAQVASVQEELVQTQMTSATISNHASITDMITYLKSGDLDAIAISSKAYESINDPEIVCTDDCFVTEDTGLYVLAKKGNTELMDQVNEVISEVKEKNLYVQWLQEAIQLKENLGDAALESIPESTTPSNKENN